MVSWPCDRAWSCGLLRSCDQALLLPSQDDASSPGDLVITDTAGGQSFFLRVTALLPHGKEEERKCQSIADFT